jgi:multimeric flavodoxin WrbA
MCIKKIRKEWGGVVKLLIHDLNKEDSEKLVDSQEDVKVICESDTIHTCIGCFACWIKTPGQCVIADEFSKMSECISKCDEVIIISKCFYGGYSPFIKNVMDRSISYVHPYFEIRNNELHHRKRYDNHFELSVYFYGEDITEKEKATAEKLVKANSINLMCKIKNLAFLKDIKSINELEGVIL